MMTEINVKKAANGYLITVTRNGVQSIYESTQIYIAKDDEELFKILKEQL